MWTHIRCVALTLTPKMWFGGWIGVVLGTPRSLGQYIHIPINKSTSLVLIVLKQRKCI